MRDLSGRSTIVVGARRGRAFFAEGTLDEPMGLPSVHDVTGRRPRTFEQWATAHAGAFTEVPE